MAIKSCVKCGAKDRYGNGKCRPCRIVSARKWQKANPDKRRASIARWQKANPDKVRAADVRWQKANPDKRRATVARWKKANPEKAKKYQIQYDYGLTDEQHNRLLLQQNNKCAICKKETVLQVDHCHESKKVRGLLCQSCNLGLGHFKDNIDNLMLSVEYLKGKTPNILIANYNTFADACDRLAVEISKLAYFENKKREAHQLGDTSKVIEWDNRSRDACEYRSMLRNEINIQLSNIVKTKQYITLPELRTFSKPPKSVAELLDDMYYRTANSAIKGKLAEAIEKELNHVPK